MIAENLIALMERKDGKKKVMVVDIDGSPNLMPGLKKLLPREIYLQIIPMSYEHECRPRLKEL